MLMHLPEVSLGKTNKSKFFENLPLTQAPNGSHMGHFLEHVRIGEQHQLPIIQYLYNGILFV